MCVRIRVCVCVCVRARACAWGGGQVIREGEEGLKAKVQRSVLNHLWLNWVGEGEGMEGVRQEGGAQLLSRIKDKSLS